jgi:HEAT repeat protein
MPINPGGATDEIRGLIEQLDSERADERSKALAELKSRGRAAFPVLVEALGHRSVKVRYAANQLLMDSQGQWKSLATDNTVQSLVDDLTCPDGFNRLTARRALSYLGHIAVPALTESLQSPEELRRWEAAKVLSQIGDPQATDTLIKALTDRVFDVRWLAAEGLINVGKSALTPLLHALIHNPQSVFLREGAHHILHELNNENISPLINPLMHALAESGDPAVEVPILARKALDVLEDR